MLREILCSNCDLGVNILDSKKIFNNFDFSFLDNEKYPTFWFLDKKNSYYDKIQKIFEEEFKGNEKELIEKGKYKILELMKDIYPNKLDSKTDMRNRAEEFKIYLKDFLDEKKPVNNVVIISHSTFIFYLTANKFDKNDNPIDSKWLNNCEIFSYNI